MLSAPVAAANEESDVETGDYSSDEGESHADEDMGDARVFTLSISIAWPKRPAGWKRRTRSPPTTDAALLPT